MRCTACGCGPLERSAADWDPDEIVAAAVACSHCGATFPSIWGVPFVGHYERDDVLGLIEIAANARADNTHGSRQDVERLEGLLEQYDAASDKRAFLSDCADEFAHAPWFGNRYGEYSAFRAVSEGIDLRNRDILDVGAGSGYDAWRLVRAGGRVTALEFNPMLIRRGRAVVPEARWIGGFSHVLPFENESFDVVCCNAALHHMRDVPAAVQEMLRVLRPGGHLLTTGDPFRADESGDEFEFDVFDEHPAVLLGVNECIPRFGEIVRTLEANSGNLDVEFLTTVGRRAAPGALRRVVGLRHWNRTLLRSLVSGREDLWPFSARKWLSAASGSLSLRVRVRRALRFDGTTQPDFVLRADEYAGVLVDHDAALSRLLPLLPEWYVDRDFPGSHQSKFELLNGWRKPPSRGDFRIGYKRARWFLTRAEHADTLHFQARRTAASGRTATLNAYVSGEPAASVPLDDRWTDVAVSLAAAPHGARFVCELRVDLDGALDASFADFCFDVRERRFA